MRGEKLGVAIGIREELIIKASSLCMKAHKLCSVQKPYLLEKSRDSQETLFSFGGFWSVDDWFARHPFGETMINAQMFPSIRSIGNNEIAKVNEAFLKRFEAIINASSLRNEVEEAATEKKQIVFSGHSSGGPIAILAGIWFLENCFHQETNQMSPLCLTFGSPLIGDRIFPHALNRQNWSRFFTHFIMKEDIVPRILLAPFSSIHHILQPILHFFNPKSTLYDHDSVSRAKEASDFYTTVMRNSASVTTHEACILMGCTNSLLETVLSFVELSPYKPFGTYVFCTGDGKLVVVRNPDAVFQLLFYSLQLSPEKEKVDDVAYKSFKKHLLYESEIKESLEMQSVVYLDDCDELPLSSDNGADDEIVMALNDLGMSPRGILCLRAAGELEKQKIRNKEKIDAKKSKIEEGLQMQELYRTNCEVRKIGYYDSFKLQRNKEDFNANVKRLELAGIWDEIITMLRKYELPEGFEGRKEWIELGTRYRRIVEPLDIANYYRNTKNEDTGPYLINGRPRRYKYTQRWREYVEKMPTGSSSEICFWAELEELSIVTSDLRLFEDVKERVLRLEEEVKKWVCGKEVNKDVLLEESSFVKWWNTLPEYHKAGSCIAGLMNM